MLISERKVIKCHNQNMAILVKLITVSLQMHENMGLKFIIFSDFGYISHILTLTLYVLTSTVFH